MRFTNHPKLTQSANSARNGMGKTIASEIRNTRRRQQYTCVIKESSPQSGGDPDAEPPHHPQSWLGQIAPTTSDRRFFVVLKSYFDKSGQEDQPYLILAGVAARDDLWGEIDRTWRAILRLGEPGEPKADYMHMCEAAPLRKHFSPDRGWTDEHVEGIVNSLISYVPQIPQDKYCQVVCTLDMGAYNKLKAEGYELDSPVDICNAYCVEAMMKWYVSYYKGGVDYEASYYFDQNEPFKPVFEAKWNRETERDRDTGTHSVWSHIKHIGSVDMRATPGVQIADMLAWGTNRENTKAERFQHLALTLRTLATSLWITWDEALLRKKYRKPEPLIWMPK